MVSGNIATSASNATILRDINANHDDMVESTMYSYLDALNRIFVIDDIPAWSPSIRSKTSIRGKNKKLFVDPSIAVASLGLSPGVLMQDFHTFGFIFENLCVRDLKIYSNALGGQISYYSDRFGLEADAVLHLNDGKYALIEFKLGSRDIEAAAKHLLQLKALIIKYNQVNQPSKLREPELLIVITGGELAYTRKDGVKIIPIGCMKD
jgi:predicted AAA+ superfamily ATPase